MSDVNAATRRRGRIWLIPAAFLGILGVVVALLWPRPLPAAVAVVSHPAIPREPRLGWAHEPSAPGAGQATTVIGTAAEGAIVIVSETPPQETAPQRVTGLDAATGQPVWAATDGICAALVGGTALSCTRLDGSRVLRDPATGAVLDEVAPSGASEEFAHSLVSEDRHIVIEERAATDVGQRTLVRARARGEARELWHRELIEGAARPAVIGDFVVLPTMTESDVLRVGSGKDAGTWASGTWRPVGDLAVLTHGAADRIVTARRRDGEPIPGVPVKPDPAERIAVALANDAPPPYLFQCLTPAAGGCNVVEAVSLTGSRPWRFPAHPSTILGFCGGHFIVTAPVGKEHVTLMGLRPDGKLGWRTNPDRAGAAEPADVVSACRRGQFVRTTGQGTTAFDARTGRLQWRAPLTNGGARQVFHVKAGIVVASDEAQGSVSLYR